MSEAHPARPTTSSEQARQEVADEQVYVDGVYDRLAEASKVARSLLVEGHARASVGHEGGLVERDAMVFQATRRLTALDAAHDGLVFGRLDVTPEVDPSGQPRYVGRIGVRDADREVVLVDWRAPAAALFYQATAQDPSGVVRRRVLRCRGDRVVGVEDDLLDADAAPDDMVVVGEGALLASLSRARDATMHSVVATIQKEQDDAIRAPSRGATTIGGGPGTGKTVVALHRAAYLLYTERRRFESGGVLVVGPSGVFMSYIERVLPSLGETSVTLRSLGEVVDGVHADRHDAPAVAAVKGSARMQRVLGRACRGPQPGGPTSFRFFYKDDVLRLDEGDLRRLRAQLLGGGQPRNRAYPKVSAALTDALWRQVRGERAKEKGREDFEDDLHDDHGYEDFLAGWWPAIDALEVLGWLRDPARLRSVAGDDLSPAEQELLVSSWSAHDDTSIEDVPVVDELRYLLGEVPQPDEDDESETPKQLMSFEVEAREQAARMRSIEDDGFAHVLVDEAQDLTPMQWRMLGRRGRHASWTIVGDAAQSSWAHPREAATARAQALEGKPQHTFRLSTNYRNSAEIYDLAADVARVAVDSPDLPDAVRRTGTEPQHVDLGPAATAEERLEAVRAAAVDVAGRVEGTVAVVVPVARRLEVATGLETTLKALDGRVSVLDGLDTKGLEFDAVVVVEPDELTTESPAGWRTLYVVLTRATQLLTTVGTTRAWRDRIGR